MKIEITTKRLKLVRLSIALIVVSLGGYVVYAASTLTIQNSGNVTVAVGPNLLASLGQTSTTTCSSTTGPYSDTGLAITTWSVPVGGSQSMYACIWNNGGTSHTLVITGSGFPTGVVFTSSVPGAVAAGAYVLVTFTLTASSTATAQPFSGATISIS
jgi:hypothetical protein